MELNSRATLCVCVPACVRAYVCACVRACVRARVRVCVRACVVWALLGSLFVCFLLFFGVFWLLFINF